MTPLIQYIADNFSAKELAEIIVDLHRGVKDMTDIRRIIEDSENEMRYEYEKAEEIWHDMQATYKSLERF